MIKILDEYEAISLRVEWSFNDILIVTMSAVIVKFIVKDYHFRMMLVEIFY